MYIILSLFVFIIEPRYIKLCTYFNICIQLVGISFLPDVILIDFHWKQTYVLEWVNKMLISLSL
jgi:hypothetical protein